MSELLPLPIDEDEITRVRDRALAGPRVPLGAPSVGSVVDRWAAACPQRVAVDDGDRSLSYGEFSTAVRGAAQQLRAHGCGTGDVVAVLGVHRAEVITTFLAIESLGSVYLPIGPDWPRSRVAAVLRGSGSRLLIDPRPEEVTAADAVVAGAMDAGVPRVRPGRDTADGLALPATRPADEARYLIYTSGSTGTPKGVLVNHLGLANHLSSKITYLGLTPDDVVALTAPLTFDTSIWQMLAGLVAGARVAIVAERDASFARRLLAALGAQRVTVAQFVPSMLRWMADELARGTSAGDQLRLTRLLSIGEKLPVRLAADLLRLLPDTALINSYGPTECSDGVSHHRVTEGDLSRSHLPIGVPIENCALYVLREDERGRWHATGPGETGELFIGGAPVGDGYLRDDRLTRAAFLADPVDPASSTGRLFRTRDLIHVAADGALEYLQRTDRQLKVSGVRVELGEIESVLLRHPAVSACAVAGTRRDGAGSTRELVAYYVVAGTVTPAELAVHLRESLPPAMIPRRWIALPDMPLTQHGKTDYHALPPVHAAPGAS